MRYRSMAQFWILATLVGAAPAAAEGYPYDLDTGSELGITATTALLLGGAYLADTNLPPLTDPEIAELEGTSVNWVDRVALNRWSPQAAGVSDILLSTMTLAPLGLLATDQGSKQPWTIGVMYAETQLINLGTVALLKNLVGRPRPYVRNPDPSIPPAAKRSSKARRSFPSGHTATTFAAATFLGVVHDRLHPDSDAGPWVWGAGLTAAATTAVLRTVAGKHYPTDLAVGAAIGVLAGWAVPQLHEVSPESGSGKSMDVPIAVFSVSF